MITENGKLELSTNLGRALHQALDDLEVMRGMPGVTIDMASWVHSVHRDGKERCSVCLAGAAMVRRCGVPGLREDGEWYPEDTTSEHVLHALDALRNGEYFEVAYDYDLISEEVACELHRFFPWVVSYNVDPPAFIRKFRSMADFLLDRIPEDAKEQQP